MIKTENHSTSKNFLDWAFGTVNIRSGKEKDEGAKIYSIAKTINNAKLVFAASKRLNTEIQDTKS